MIDPVVAKRFEQIVLPHMNSAFNVARWLTRNDDDAKDIVQEACLRALRFFGTFRNDDARSWLLSIVRNTFYTWHQKNRLQACEYTVFDEELHSLEVDLGVFSCDPEAMFIRNQSQTRVHLALRDMRLEFREVLVLRELEELSYKEISVIVGIPIGTVMSRLARGRQQLAELLGPKDQL
jgi:RNA polymerase sigma factor (sigma-70 family)